MSAILASSIGGHSFRGSFRKIAARFGVDPSTVQRISRPFVASVAAYATRTLTTTVGPSFGGAFYLEIQAFSRVLPGVDPVLIRHGSGARFFQKGKHCQ
jgi:uncharacterized membrane protein